MRVLPDGAQGVDSSFSGIHRRSPTRAVLSNTPAVAHSVMYVGPLMDHVIISPRKDTRSTVSDTSTVGATSNGQPLNAMLMPGIEETRRSARGSPAPRDAQGADPARAPSASVRAAVRRSPADPTATASRQADSPSARRQSDREQHRERRHPGARRPKTQTGSVEQTGDREGEQNREGGRGCDGAGDGDSRRGGQQNRDGPGQPGNSNRTGGDNQGAGNQGNPGRQPGQPGR